MSEILIRGRHVICGVDREGLPQIINDGAVLSKEGSIADVGEFHELMARYPDADLLGSENDVLLPGLVNAHHHTGLTPIQHGICCMPLEFWLPNLIGMRTIDPYLDTLYSAIEMLESGVTTVQHIHPGPTGPRDQWVDTAEQIIKAYRDIGMRVSYCFMLRDRNHIVYGSDQEFLSRLPSGLRPRISAMLDTKTHDTSVLCEFFEELVKRWNRSSTPTVRVQLAPANLHWCSDRCLEHVRDCAERHGVSLHMHLLETPYQKEFAVHATHQQSAVHHLADIGLLGPKMTLGHGNWMTEEDIELVVATDTRICHNASSGIRLQSGIAPVRELLERGVKVALGIDQAGINDDRDMLQEMRVAWCLQRVPGHKIRPPDALTIFRMATEFGAATTDFEHQIGKIEVGRSTDLFLIDWRKITRPYLDRDTPIMEAILHRGRTQHVHTVLVAGRVVMKSGELTTIDKQDVLDRIEHHLSRPLSPDEAARRRISRHLLPHVQKFYEDWPPPNTSIPFGSWNSRR